MAFFELVTECSYLCLIAAASVEISLFARIWMLDSLLQQRKEPASRSERIARQLLFCNTASLILTEQSWSDLVHLKHALLDDLVALEYECLCFGFHGQSCTAVRQC